MLRQIMTVELIDKNTGNVVETRTITASSGIQNSQLPRQPLREN